MTKLSKYVLMLALLSPQLRAQDSPKGPPKEFDVASIKPAEPGTRGVRLQMTPGGGFNAKNVTAKFLIQQAYGVRDFQISGGPSWITSEHYDINAKAEGATSTEQLRPLIQALLADRFHLTIHRDTKELPMYALVAGKNGPKLKESSAAPAPGPGREQMMRMGRGLIDGQGMSMTVFAAQLAQQLGRSVTDKTGLTGNYDIKLEWTPDESQSPFPRDPAAEAAHPIDTTGPTVFTALQEQLGLKLESQKGAVEMIVIDRIEKATEN